MFSCCNYHRVLHKMLIALLMLFMVSRINSEEESSIKIGVIFDKNSRMGKEQKTAMDIAVESFNNGGSSSINHHHDHHANLSLIPIDYDQGHLLQTVLAAQKQVEANQVQVIIVGIDNWQATSLLAQVASQAQVPTFSLAASPPITSPSPSSLQWPFLVQMAYDSSQQTHHLVSIIHAYHWHRVTLVSEADPYGGDTGTLFVLTEALQKVGSQVEHHLVLPPYGSTLNHTSAVQEAFAKFLDEDCYSRAFIVLKISLPYVSHLFKEAKGKGLMGNDSAWIITEEIANFLPSCFNSSTMLSMDGALGLMTMFDNSTTTFQEFQARFWLRFSQEHQEENDQEPGFHALLAYDAITTITTAISSLKNPTAIHSLKNRSATGLKGVHFLREILRSNFTGLSGRVYFDQDNHTLLDHPETKMVNIVGENYHEILDFGSEDFEDGTAAQRLGTEAMTWPGNLRGVVPKGWMMPTQKKPLRIGVPVVHIYKNFIDYHGPNQSDECVPNITSENEDYDGFCPELFREVVKILDYDLPYQFVPYNGSYDGLVDHVHNKSFDAVVGDVTILANRTELVEFTLPFEESALSIVLPAVEPYNSHDSWIFLRPFTPGMWLLTLLLLVYTMIVVWLLEHKDNEDFRGSWRNQLSTAVWFTFSSLFFAQRERVSSNLARVVVITWLFIVLILTQSYTANLTSMLTIDRLNQTTIDMGMLKRSNAKVGYDDPSFVNKFLEDLFQFNASNIVGIKSEFEEFHRQFQARNITAAFLEVLYAQLFATQYCNQYTITTPGYRYGGLAFVFPKGSPLANDVSQAILNLTESGKLKDLEKSRLNINSGCYISSDDFTTDSSRGSDDQSSSLSLKSFWVLLAFSGATSTLCFLAFLFASCKTRTRSRVGVAPAQANNVLAPM